MSGTFIIREPNWPANRKSTLKKMWMPYSGKTSWKREVMPTENGIELNGASIDKVCLKQISIYGYKNIVLEEPAIGLRRWFFRATFLPIWWRCQARYSFFTSYGLTRSAERESVSMPHLVVGGACFCFELGLLWWAHSNNRSLTWPLFQAGFSSCNRSALPLSYSAIPGGYWGVGGR